LWGSSGCGSEWGGLDRLAGMAGYKGVNRSWSLPSRVRVRGCRSRRCPTVSVALIAGKGRMAWQRDSGYNERARVEGQFARWKQVIGDGLRFHSDQARATEVAIAAAVLNRMLDLGCPSSVRVA
jgi:hypothetical protein